MPDLSEVYRRRADHYERMIRTEDYEGNLLPAIEAICPLDGLDVIELGAGTGRLTRLIAPRARSIRSADRSQAMLLQAQRVLPAFGMDDPALAMGDHRALPFPAHCADLVIQGWSFLQMKVWEGENWRAALQRGHDETMRVLRPGGTILHIETLGTGHTEPTVPDHFRTLYDWWERDLGFTSTWIRTDYRFASRQEAEELTIFFFGEDITETFIGGDQPVLPECTGLWWRRV